MTDVIESGFLPDLPDVLRAAGLTVIEVDGWATRARSGGGYDSNGPSHLMIHHTATPACDDGEPDVEFIASGASAAPISNLYTDRSGRMWVCAAGATNTNGEGCDTWGGGVPADAMNLHAIGIEVANTGVGEPYPRVQQDAVVRASIALCGRYGIAAHCVRGHFEWAPRRKIDPGGPSRWAPSGGRWDMDAFRREVAAGSTPSETFRPSSALPSGRMQLRPRTSWTFALVGWVLFTVSAVFFTIASVRDGGVIGLVASLSFLVACVIFMIPLIANGPPHD